MLVLIPVVYFFFPVRAIFLLFLPVYWWGFSADSCIKGSWIPLTSLVSYNTPIVLSRQIGKKIHPLPERMASLGIMEAQLGASFKPLSTMLLWWSERFQGSTQSGTMMPRDASIRLWLLHCSSNLPARKKTAPFENLSIWSLHACTKIEPFDLHLFLQAATVFD